MKMLTIMYHRTSGLRERGISTHLEVRALLLFCCLVCAKVTHSLINPNPQLPTAYREHFCTTLIANRGKKWGGLFFFLISQKSRHIQKSTLE